jgi:hypothetical protein
MGAEGRRCGGLIVACDTADGPAACVAQPACLGVDDTAQ